MKWIVLFLFSTGLLLAGSAGVVQADLMINGGFESGSFSPGWTNSDPTHNSVVTSQPSLSYFPQQGNFFALMGTPSVLSSISQTVADINGARYIFEFSYASNGISPNELKVQFGSIVVFDQMNLPATGVPSNHTYTFNTFLLTGTGSDTVTISVRDDNSFLAIDNVGLISLVPEPSSLVLAGLATAGFVVGGWRRWRKSRQETAATATIGCL
jgi:PEP-CTERM motif